MNKLKTLYAAGVDFNWDDLAWMQDATRDALYGILSTFGIDPDESFIFSGCVVTIGPSSASTTAGYISLNGEILKVEAHSISYDGSSPVVWRIQETDDASGTEQDSNGNTVECYQKRVAVLYQASSYTNEMAYNADSLINVISAHLELSTAWTEIPYNASYFSGTNLVMDGTNTKIFYKRIGSTMHLSFRLSVTSMDSSILTFSLAAATGYKSPDYFRPAAGIRKMSGNDGPILIMSYVSAIRFTEYNADLPALTSAYLYGQMTLEVEPV